MAGSSIGSWIKKSGVVVFLFPRSKYSERVGDVAKACSMEIGRFCFVSMNRPFETMEDVFRKAGVDLKNVVFIDAVTSGFQSHKGVKVFSVSSPRALTEINIAMNNVIEKEKAAGVVVDSLSTLLVYEAVSEVIKFAHSIISDIRERKVKGVLLALAEDVNSELVKDLSMFADKVLEVK